jgi:DNA-binding beta-propeller fold protein YncE
MVSEDVPGAPGGFGPGSRIAGYVLEEQIGRGGMAVVFRAVDERLDRRVALKLLAPALAADQAFRQRFIRESRAAAAVDNPHIIPVFEAGEAGGILYIAMRYVRGGDMKSLLRESAPLHPWRAALIVSQVASALDAAHEQGLVHRDVKPANMLREPAAARPDYIYLSDFGLSKALLDSVRLTRTGQFLGTPDYLAPEQIEGKTVDGRADQYALGCVAFEMLCGSPPFDLDDPVATMYAHGHQPPPPLSSRVAGMPAEVDAVFAKVLAKSPADRYESCREFADELRAALDAAYGADSGPSPAPAHPATEVATPVRPEAGSGAGASGTAADADREATRLASASPPGASRSGATQIRPIPTAAPGSPPGGESPPAEPGSAVRQPRRFWWRSPATLVAVVLLCLALGAGFLLANRAGGGTHGAHGRHGHSGGPAILTAPGCSSSASVLGTVLTGTHSNLKHIGQSPSGVAVTPDGQWVFASTSGSQGPGGRVLAMQKGPALKLTVQRSYQLSSPAMDDVLTSDGRYLLVAAGTGVVVLNVQSLEAGSRGAQFGTLPSPKSTGHGGALAVAVSRGNKYVFMMPVHGSSIAVFNFGKALQLGRPSISDLVGNIRLGSQATGMAVSPDGDWLYVTSSPAGGGNAAGSLTVISVRTAEMHPPAAVVATAAAGCSPSSVITSPDGQVVWVAERGSNGLLAFSAAKLRTDRKRALLAVMKVGHEPTGLISVAGGKRIVVADSGSYLAVVSVQAQAGHATLLGRIPGGLNPHDFALAAGPQTLLVTDAGSDQIQLIDLGTLP